MVVFWHISNRQPRISLQYPQVCITAIFTKYCYATGRWFLEPMSQYTLLGVLAVRGKSFWNRTIDMALFSGNTFSIGVCVLTKSPPKGFRSWKRVEWMASNLPGWYILTDFRNGYALLIISINPYTEKTFCFRGPTDQLACFDGCQPVPGSPSEDMLSMINQGLAGLACWWCAHSFSFLSPINPWTFTNFVPNKPE